MKILIQLARQIGKASTQAADTLAKIPKRHGIGLFSTDMVTMLVQLGIKGHLLGAQCVKLTERLGVLGL